MQADDFFAAVEARQEADLSQSAIKISVPSFPCALCDRTFDTAQGLAVHMGRAHGSVPKLSETPKREDKPCAEECDHTERPRYTGEPVTVTLVNTLVYTDMANELMTLHAKLARTLLMCGESTESILPHLDRIIELSGGQS